MAASENSLNKVRSILGKMDRSITDARRRRLGEPDTTQNQIQGEEDQLLIGKAELDEVPAKSDAPQQLDPVSPMRARYGKAKPIGQRPGNLGDNGINFHAKPA